MKLSYAETLQTLNEGMPVNSKDVHTAALNKDVWIYSWGKPGCLPEYTTYSETRFKALLFAKDVISDSQALAELDENCTSNSESYMGTVQNDIYCMYLVDVVS